MDEIRYEAPTTVAATLALLSAANGHAKVLAGGTDLLVQMRAGRVEPELLVDIKRLPETTAITSENGRFRFGAALSCM
ncbi:MAG: FAD binding domain-containing protein, partial [Burkholderiales bacterium]